MKKLLLIASLFVVTTAQAQQKAVKDAQGNYTVTSHRDTVAGKPTGHTITDSKGNVYPLLLSSRGRLYYMRTSRTGNVYKCYIKVDQN